MNTREHPMNTREHPIAYKQYVRKGFNSTENGSVHDVNKPM